MSAATRNYGLKPVLIGPKNAEQATGLPWRWLRDHFTELVIRVEGKGFIPADRLLAALEARAAVSAPEVEVDEVAEMRARIARAG